jgi:hypothetical protein
MGISGIGNLIASIKLARYYELGREDIVLTVLTDSVEMYGSRLRELDEREGRFDHDAAIRAHAVSLLGQRTDNVLELDQRERKRIHNLKYYTWVEQQGKTAEELTAQWSDRGYWAHIQEQAPLMDEMIGEFNREVGIVS